jgi:hypothetical protein
MTFLHLAPFGMSPLTDTTWNSHSYLKEMVKTDLHDVLGGRELGTSDVLGC